MEIPTPSGFEILAVLGMAVGIGAAIFGAFRAASRRLLLISLGSVLFGFSVVWFAGQIRSEQLTLLGALFVFGPIFLVFFNYMFRSKI